MTAIMKFHVFVGAEVCLTAKFTPHHKSADPIPTTSLQTLSPLVTDKKASGPERELPSLPNVQSN